MMPDTWKVVMSLRGCCSWQMIGDWADFVVELGKGILLST